MKIILQFIAYVAFSGVVILFSAWPEIQLRGPNEAIISLSFSHSGKRIGECTRLTQEELLALPPNMRTADACPRERHPVLIELLVDDTSNYLNSVEPSGLWRDGKSTIYYRQVVTAGEHEVTVRMTDSGSSNTFDYQFRQTLEIIPGQNLVVSFDSDSGGFFLHKVRP